MIMIMIITNRITWRSSQSDSTARGASRTQSRGLFPFFVSNTFALSDADCRHALATFVND
jgi:hypothetical protein